MYEGPLYLQEKVQTRGQRPNRPAYARELVALSKAWDAARSPFRIVSAWELCGMTGPWPQVMGLYEFSDGWATVADLVRQSMRTPSPELAANYANVEQMRYGGNDEILAPAPGSPTLDELIASELRGTLLVWEEARVAAGLEQQYIERVQSDWLPVMSDHGHVNIGLYQGVLTDGLVVAYWLTTLDQFEALAKSRQIEQWRRRSAEGRQGWRIELWTGAPGSRFATGDIAFDESGNFAGEL